MMLKEQVARILKGKMALEKCDPDVMPYFTDYYWIPKDEVANLAQEIINLFKAEVAKLTVIDDIPLKNISNVSLEEINNIIKRKIEAQLQHTKKQLLDLMGE